MEINAEVWVKDEETDSIWIHAVIRSKDEHGITVALENGTERTFVADEVKICNTYGQGGTGAADVEDLIQLTFLHEPEILHSLSRRFEADKIYTSTGPILLAVNPFKRIPSLKIVSLTPFSFILILIMSNFTHRQRNRDIVDQFPELR